MHYKKNKKPAGITLAQVRRGVLPKQYRRDKKIVEAFCLLHIYLTMIVVKHPRVAVDLPGTWSGKIDSMFQTFQGISDNTNGWYTPQPTNPAIDHYKEFVTTLSDRQKDVISRLPDSVNIRNAAYDEALQGTKSLRGYIQALCDVNPLHAKEIAAEAHMILSFSKGREKNIFTATSTIPGQVDLNGVRKAVHQASDWEMSTDQNDPAKWLLVKIPPTLAASTSVKGLTSNTDLFFRSRVILVEGPQIWSPVIKVHVV